MEPVPIFSPAFFTPAEAEVITGVDAQTQRAWRMRGHIQVRRNDRHARFDVWHLAYLLALRMLASCRGGPLLVREPAGRCALKIADYLVRDVHGWSGEHELVGAWAAAWWARKQQRDQRKAEVLAPIKIDPVNMSADDGQMLLDALATLKAEAEPGSGWDAQRDWLLTRLYRERGIDTIPAERFFAWWADGTFEFVVDIRMGFEGSTGDPRYDGPVSVLDLDAIAACFSERIGRPVMHVSLMPAHAVAPRRRKAGT